jgi:hypothetical protein
MLWGSRARRLRRPYRPASSPRSDHTRARGTRASVRAIAPMQYAAQIGAHAAQSSAASQTELMQAMLSRLNEIAALLRERK